MPKTARSVVLPEFGLDPGADRPLHIQIYNRLRGSVLEGALKAGAPLPSTRALAEELRVSRTTVLAAYDQLLAEGYIESRVGAGTFVAAELPEDTLNVAEKSWSRGLPPHSNAGERALSARGERMSRLKFGPDFRLAEHTWRVPFRVAVPALDGVPFELWSRLIARHARRPSQAALDYQDGHGLHRLRAAIAAHISLSRGIRCTADQILITTGAQSAIDLAVRVLLDPGDKAIVEDPAHLGIRGALQGVGVRIIPVPVDSEGLVVKADGAFRRGARLAFVTPSNQFPLGVTMSLSRRLALLDWATRTGAWILEDDYDSEFRYVGRPIEALQALDRAGRVLYIGSFSKVLFPSLRLGYLVVPADLADAFASARRFVDVHPPVLLQAALADFIVEGHLGRHLRRMRVAYRERADALKLSADRYLMGLLDVEPPQAGMHTVGWLPEQIDGTTAWAAAAKLGVEARPLSLYSIGRTRPGLVLGFGAVRPSEIERGVRKLASALISLKSI